MNFICPDRCESKWNNILGSWAESRDNVRNYKEDIQWKVIVRSASQKLGQAWSILFQSQ